MLYLILPKILAVSGLITAASVVAAQQIEPNVPAGVLVFFATVTLGTNLALGFYAKYREARSKADAVDIRKEMDGCKREIGDLKALLSERDGQIEQWKSLYQAVTSGRASPRNTRQKSEPN